MIKVTRSFTFDAAHRLPTHSGRCRNLHGHTYRVEVAVSIPDERLNSQGMIVDFGAMKRTIGAWINTNLDHKTILVRYDPLVKKLTAANGDHATPMYLTDSIPTAEEFAKMLLKTAQALLNGKRRRVSAVTVYETPLSWATATPQTVEAVVAGEIDEDEAVEEEGASVDP